MKGGGRYELQLPDRVPVGAKGHIALDLGYVGGGSRAPSECSRHTFNDTTSQAHVNVIGSGAEVLGIAHPLVTEALKASRLKKFSGRSEDFEEFERQWKQYLKLMYNTNQTSLPDTMVLLTLRGYLDKASATHLDSQMAIDPDLPYYKFFEDFKTRYMKDARATHRQNWQAVKLRKVGDYPTLQEWAEFQAQYLGRRALVEDWMDAEDQQMVFKQLPTELQKKVHRETTKRRQGRMWVRVSIPPGLTGQQVQEQLEHVLDTALPIDTMERRQFVVRCESEEDQQALLQMDGAKLRGKVIKVQRAEYTMTGDEMLNLVRRYLEEDEELRRWQRTSGVPETGNRAGTGREAAGGIFAVAEDKIPEKKTQDPRPREAEPQQPRGGKSGKNAKGGQYQGGQGRGWGGGQSWDNRGQSQGWYPPGKGKGYASQGYDQSWSGHGRGAGRGAAESAGGQGPQWKSKEVCHACAMVNKPSEHSKDTCPVYKKFQELREKDEKEGKTPVRVAEAAKADAATSSRQ